MSDAHEDERGKGRSAVAPHGKQLNEWVAVRFLLHLDSMEHLDVWKIVSQPSKHKSFSTHSRGPGQPGLASGADAAGHRKRRHGDPSR